ncbi:hypothetical protein ACSQ67_000452 [Phaseolus vulgaris]
MQVRVARGLRRSPPYARRRHSFHEWIAGARLEESEQKEECNASPEAIYKMNPPVESNLATKKREDLTKGDDAAAQRPSVSGDAEGVPP